MNTFFNTQWETALDSELRARFINAYKQDSVNQHINDRGLNEQWRARIMNNSSLSHRAARVHNGTFKKALHV